MDTTITIKIAPQVKRKVIEWAKKKGLKRSYAYQLVFENGLEATGELKINSHEH